MTKLQWIHRSRPSALHAAAGLDAGYTPVDNDLAQASAQPLVETIDRLRVLDVDRPAFWRHLVTASSSTEATLQIVTTVFQRAFGPVAEQPRSHQEICLLISTIVSEAKPHLVNPQELELRSGPLKTQWQSYGPGLLLDIARRTDPNLLVDRAQLVIVQPVFGGAGGAHLRANTVHIEAMMVNVNESLPEVLRLAWLVSQLQHALPIYSESINQRDLPTISALALLPAALEAANELGLATFGPETLELAIANWRISAGDPSLVAEIVATWWETASGGKYAWGTALQALDRMLQPIRCVHQ
jgi:hypothetical protein